MHRWSGDLLAIGLMAVVTLAGCGAAPRASGTEITVRMAASTFEFKTLEVKVGTAVRWVNADALDHAVWEGVPDSGKHLFATADLGPGGSFSYTFEIPGSYQIFCPTGGHHLQGMRMQVVVKR